MASMNGLEVKGVKFYPDHEGAMIPYGNIYFKGKKVAAFREDAWGGPIVIDFTHKTISQQEVEDAFHGIVKKLGWDDFYDSIDILVEELIELKEYESIFKKQQKDNRILILIREDYTVNRSVNAMFPATYYNPKNPTEAEIKMYAEKLKEKYPKGVIHVFRTLDDFNL